MSTMATFAQLSALPTLGLVALLGACGGAGEGPAASAALPAMRQSGLVGINIKAPLDWEGDRLYADVARMARDFQQGTDENGGVPAPLDPQGWPTSDFSFYVWAGPEKMHGRYALTFQGQAEVYAHPAPGPIQLSFEGASNTSSGTIYYPINAANSFLALRFSKTRRSQASDLESGVSTIRIMRPVTPGSRRSYPASTVFHTPILDLIAKFSTIRYMDFLATNWNRQKNWADRMLPASPSYARSPPGHGWQGLGGPWEHVTLLSNRTGKDAWINLPVAASDDYVRKVAQLLAYGSDGFVPYTAPQANPVYPPLDADIRIYVEFSNEVWNGSFSQMQDNCLAASDELVATSGATNLNWDGSWNGVPYGQAKWNWSFCSRRTTRRSIEISNIFRSVFGEAGLPQPPRQL